MRGSTTKDLATWALPSLLYGNYDVIARSDLITESTEADFLLDLYISISNINYKRLHVMLYFRDAQRCNFPSSFEKIHMAARGKLFKMAEANAQRS